MVKCRQEQRAWRLEREVCSRRCEGIDFCEFRAQVTATTTRTLPRSCCGRSWSSSTAGLQTHLHAHARAHALARTRTRADTRAGSHTCTIASKRSFAHCRHRRPEAIPGEAIGKLIFGRPLAGSRRRWRSQRSLATTARKFSGFSTAAGRCALRAQRSGPLPLIQGADGACPIWSRSSDRLDEPRGV